jgi:hypothetical protein
VACYYPADKEVETTLYDSNMSELANDASSMQITFKEVTAVPDPAQNELTMNIDSTSAPWVSASYTDEAEYIA